MQQDYFTWLKYIETIIFFGKNKPVLDRSDFSLKNLIGK